MANLKDIAATLAILGSGALLVGCGKDKPATEVPAGGDAASETPAEASCGEGKTEGSCGEGKTEGSCGEGKTEEGEPPAGEASCGGK